MYSLHEKEKKEKKGREQIKKRNGNQRRKDNRFFEDQQVKGELQLSKSKKWSKKNWMEDREMKMHQPLNGFDRRPVVQGERFYSASGRGVATPSRLISRELLLPIKLSIMRRGRA